MLTSLEITECCTVPQAYVYSLSVDSEDILDTKKYEFKKLYFFLFVPLTLNFLYTDSHIYGLKEVGGKGDEKFEDWEVPVHSDIVTKHDGAISSNVMSNRKIAVFFTIFCFNNV